MKELENNSDANSTNSRRKLDENSWKTRARVFRREFVEFASDFMNKIAKNIHVPYLSPAGTFGPRLFLSKEVKKIS